MLDIVPVPSHRSASRDARRVRVCAVFSAVLHCGVIGGAFVSWSHRTPPPGAAQGESSAAKRLASVASQAGESDPLPPVEFQAQLAAPTPPSDVKKQQNQVTQRRPANEFRMDPTLLSDATRLARAQPPANEADTPTEPDVTPRINRTQASAVSRAVPLAEALDPGTSVKSKPRFTYSPKPRYSRSLWESGITGTVMVRLFLDESGSVYDAQLTQSSGHNALDKAAVDAVLTWRAVPEMKNGVPVKATYIQPFVFAAPIDADGTM